MLVRLLCWLFGVGGVLGGIGWFWYWFGLRCWLKFCVGGVYEDGVGWYWMGIGGVEYCIGVGVGWLYFRLYCDVVGGVGFWGGGWYGRNLLLLFFLMGLRLLCLGRVFEYWDEIDMEEYFCEFMFVFFGVDLL